MLNKIPVGFTLFPMETEESYFKLEADLKLIHEPADDEESQLLFERLVTASFLRRRYEKVIDSLIAKRNTQENESPERMQTNYSINRFKEEASHQKNAIRVIAYKIKTIKKASLCQQK